MVLNITKKADLWILSQKNIQRVEDLRGKMIGVGGNWGTQFYLVLEALKHYGADKDVQLVSTGDVANGYLSLQQGSMPAVALTPPYSILAKRQGYRDLVRTGDVVSVSPTTGLVTTREKIEREPQRIRRVIRAVMKAVDYAKGRKAETVQFIMRQYKMEREVADSVYDAVMDRAGERARGVQALSRHPCGRARVPSRSGCGVGRRLDSGSGGDARLTYPCSPSAPFRL